MSNVTKHICGECAKRDRVHAWCPVWAATCEAFHPACKCGPMDENGNKKEEAKK